MTIITDSRIVWRLLELSPVSTTGDVALTPVVVVLTDWVDMVGWVDGDGSVGRVACVVTKRKLHICTSTT